jgi:hypothetical protein
MKICAQAQFKIYFKCFFISLRKKLSMGMLLFLFFCPNLTQFCQKKLQIPFDFCQEKTKLWFVNFKIFEIFDLRKNSAKCLT